MSLLPENLPPHALEAEMATLGAGLMSRPAAERVLEMLERDDFYAEANRKIYAAMAGLLERDTPPDALTVPEELERRGELDTVGGMAYVGRVLESVPTAAHVEHYAKIVREKANLRRLVEASHANIADVYGEELPPDAVQDRAERRIFAVGERREARRLELVPMRSIAQDVMSQMEARLDGTEPLGIRTGFGGLDEKTGGLEAGDFIIVAGRPSMGKTTFSLQLAAQVAASTGPVAFFSLEMPRRKLGIKLISLFAKVNSKRLETPHVLNQAEWDAVGSAAGCVGDLPLLIEDAGMVSVHDVLRLCRRARSQVGKLSLVVVDYLQLLASHGKFQNRNDEVSAMARECKRIARELEVPLVGLSQLSRSVERRDDKRPMLSDLRDSGGLEAEADIVLFPFRPGYYRRKQAGEPEPDQDEAELIIAKHRTGEVTSLPMTFFPRFSRFFDQDRRHEYNGYLPPDRPRYPDA